MIVHVAPHAHVTLEDPDTFTAFSIRAPGLALDEVVAALGDEAHAADDEHVWVPIARLHALGRIHGGPDWRKGCDDMLRYAATQGWIDAGEERVRAHLERRGP